MILWGFGTIKSPVLRLDFQTEINYVNKKKNIAKLHSNLKMTVSSAF